MRSVGCIFLRLTPRCLYEYGFLVFGSKCLHLFFDGELVFMCLSSAYLPCLCGDWRRLDGFLEGDLFAGLRLHLLELCLAPVLAGTLLWAKPLETPLALAWHSLRLMVDLGLHGFLADMHDACRVGYHA